MSKFVSILLKNKMFVVILCIIIVVVGLYSYYIIPKQENPGTSVAAATVITAYPGASPKEVEQQVTNVLESEIAALEGIDYYTSQSINNASIIVIMYDIDVTVDEVESKLRQTISDAQSDLPELAQESVIDTNLSGENQFLISLSGKNYSSDELVNYANIVKDTIIEVDGIEQVVIEGEIPNQVVISANSSKMQTYGISLENILQLLQAQNISIPTGGINYNGEQVNVITPAVFENMEDIETLTIGALPDNTGVITLSDIADIYTESVSDYYFSQDGENAVLISGTIQKGQNAVIVGQKLRQAIDDAQNDVPSDIVFHEIMYAPTDIENSINDFIFNLIQSILLIVVVVMVGVHLRNGIIVSVALPLSILTTFIVMNLLGLEFHFITIAGLIVSLGILVDNAIVVSEAIQHHLNSGIQKQQAITNALSETAVPVLTSTLTTIVTFSIIYFVPGVVGQVAGDIPTVVITALIASYFVAMLVIPVFAFWFFKPEHKSKRRRKNIVGVFFKFMLKLGLKHKILTVLAAFISLGVAAVLALSLGIQFFPVADKPVIYINYESDKISLQACEEVSEDINSVLKQQNVVDNFTYSVGIGLPNFFLTVPSVSQAPNVGQYVLQLNSEEMQTLGGVEATAKHIQDLLDKTLENASATVRCLEYSMPTDAKIAFVVSGKDTDKIYEVAADMEDALNKIQGTDRVRSTSLSTQSEYVVHTNTDELTNYGLLKFDVIRQVDMALMSVNVGTLNNNDTNPDIVLQTDIDSVEQLEDMHITSSSLPISIPLSQIANIELTQSVPVINHYNSEYYADVLSNVLPGYSSVSIESELFNNYIDNMDLEGITITGKGEVNNMSLLLLALISSASLAVMLIYLILIFQFKNLKHPLIVLASIPLSFIGCGFGLWVFGMDIQAMALLGLVSLFGIVVNNSILLIEVMNAKVNSGKTVEQACKSAVSLRFRPIMLSSITTCVGLVPLIVSGDTMTAPMASVLLFGLLFSTILTMVVVPTIYAIQTKNKKPL